MATERAPRRRERPRATGRKGRGGIVRFLLASVVPLAALGFFLAQPEARRKEILERIPAGAGGRAIAAAIAFGALLLLARVALPAFHGTSAGLLGARARIRDFPMGARILLAPFDLLLGLLWFLVQLLFAVDAFLVLLAALLTLLLAVRIAVPDLLPGILPDLAR